MTIVLVLVIGVLFGTGSYLLLQRSLSRIVIGLAMLGHGANLLLLLAGGDAGRAPILDGAAVGPVSDPLPQALALTAIVISFAASAFLLTLSYRSWALRNTDEVEDDVEDRRIALITERARARERQEEEEAADAERSGETTT
ncbi:MAG: Na(+)/H(+) antiporter subunit C [Acidimicrobiia bacterium]